ncbi:MAG: hypothetical protein ACQES0_04575 [Bacteroidota bacterium]
MIRQITYIAMFGFLFILSACQDDTVYRASIAITNNTEQSFDTIQLRFFPGNPSLLTYKQLQPGQTSDTSKLTNANAEIQYRFVNDSINRSMHLWCGNGSAPSTQQFLQGFYHLYIIRSAQTDDIIITFMQD